LLGYRWLPPPQQPQQAFDDVSQGCDALGNRPDSIQPQGIDGHAPEGGQDLVAVDFLVAVGVFPELGVTDPVPAVLNRPAMANMAQQGLGSSPQTYDVVTGLFGWLPLASALAAHGKERGAARPLLHHPLRCWHRQQRPGDVTAVDELMPAGPPRHAAAVDEPDPDELKPRAATEYDSDQEVGAALGEVEEKGRLACSASACTRTPSSTTACSSCRRAWVSLPASVA